MSDFTSEETKRYLIEHQQAVVKRQKVELAALTYKRLQEEKEARRKEGIAKAIAMLKKFREGKYWGTPAATMMDSVSAKLRRGELVTTEELRKLTRRMSQTS